VGHGAAGVAEDAADAAWILVILVNRVVHGVGNIGSLQSVVQVAAEALHQLLGAAVHVEDGVVRGGVTQHHDIVHIIQHLYQFFVFPVVFLSSSCFDPPPKNTHALPPLSECADTISEKRGIASSSMTGYDA